MEEDKAKLTESEILKRKPGRPPKVEADESVPVPAYQPPAAKEVTDPCWNCGLQLEFDKCVACGFDRGLIHNPDLDSKREALRRKVTNQ